jgi:hypothetical protein
MIYLSSAWCQILSELFVNLAAGWFGAGIIIPVFNKQISIDIVLSSLVGLILSVIFYLIALSFLKR